MVRSSDLAILIYKYTTCCQNQMHLAYTFIYLACTSIWKLAVTPVIKSGSKTYVNNNRPISVISGFKEIDKRTIICLSIFKMIKVLQKIKQLVVRFTP